MPNISGKKSQRPFLYRSLASYLREIFGRPIRKVPVDPGFGCPNRDGTLSRKGCAFCHPESFVPPAARSEADPVSRVLAWRGRNPREPFIVYLQAGTGTYADHDRFGALVNNLLDIPGAEGLFIATRPDCVDGGIMEILEPWLFRKLIWLELGLQSAHDRTLGILGRGHDAAAFTAASKMAGRFGVPVLAHIILGLPGEGPEEMIQTARFLADLEVEGVKIHHLQIIRKTPMARMLEEGKVVPLSWESYPALVTAFLEELPSSVVVHRLLADAPEDLLLAPRWPEKGKVLAAVREYMEKGGYWQGRVCEKRRGKSEGRRSRVSSARTDDRTNL